MQMVILVALVAFGAAVALTPVAMAVAVRTGVVDRPGPLKRQSAPVPYLGGVAVFVAVVPGAVLGRGAMLVPLGAATALGVVDDRFGLPAWVRVVGQLAVGAGIAAVVHVRVGGVAGPVLVVLATVILMNGVNLIDGLDALAAGVVGVGSAAFVFLLRGDDQYLAASFAFALAGFLVYNRPPARVYLGDGGSYLLGAGLAALLACAWVPALSTSTGVASLLVVAVPGAEVACAMVRRLRAGRAITAGDRRHPYDILVGRGWPVVAASLSYIGAEAVLGAAGVPLARAPVAVAAMAVGVGALALLAVAGALGALAPEGVVSP